MGLGKKTIMIFGAGINQIELIREAKKLDIITVVIDPSDNPPGKAESDYFYAVPGNDYETTIAIALNHKINGIATGQMEKPLRLMAKLAAEIGLNFHDELVIEKTLNKWLMKKTFLNHNIPCAKGIILNREEELTLERISNLKFPLIIKPVDAFSSRGVYKADSFIELKYFRNDSRNYSSIGSVIIEEFIEGKEYSIESITYQGDTHIIQFTEKIITPYPNTIEMGHLQPADLTDTEKNQITQLIKNAITALGIDNSASHAEVILNNAGPQILEIAARLGGDFISSYLTKSSTGISMDKAAVQIALGEKPDLARTTYSFAYIKYFHLPEGSIVESINSINIKNPNKELVFFKIFAKPGDNIPKLSHSAQRTGCVLVKGENSEKVIALANYYESIVKGMIQLKTS